jgi:hypothetical protein
MGMAKDKVVELLKRHLREDLEQSNNTRAVVFSKPNKLSEAEHSKMTSLFIEGFGEGQQEGVSYFVEEGSYRLKHNIQLSRRVEDQFKLTELAIFRKAKSLNVAPLQAQEVIDSIKQSLDKAPSQVDNDRS